MGSTLYAKPPKCFTCNDLGHFDFGGVTIGCPEYHRGERPLSRRRKAWTLLGLVVLSWALVAAVVAAVIVR